jgi:hypothetical protein
VKSQTHLPGHHRGIVPKRAGADLGRRKRIRKTRSIVIVLVHPLPTFMGLVVVVKGLYVLNAAMVRITYLKKTKHVLSNHSFVLVARNS